MIKHLKQAAIDREQWDACIQASPAGRLYAYSWYLDQICSAWEGMVYGEYEAVMPLVYRKKFGVSYLFLPFSAQQLGVFAHTETSAKLVREMIRAIPDQFRVIDLKLNATNQFEDSEYEVIENTNYELLLDQPHELLKKNYSDNTKRNIRKSTKAGCVISVGEVHYQQVIEGFKMTRGKTFKALDDRFYDTLAGLTEACLARDQAEVYAVHDSNRNVLTTALFLKDEQRTYYILSGNTEQGRKVGGMHFLLDQLIAREAESGRVLDFEGSNNANLARFYGSFGARSSVYLQVRKNRLPGFLKRLKSG